MLGTKSIYKLYLSLKKNYIENIGITLLNFSIKEGVGIYKVDPPKSNLSIAVIPVLIIIDAFNNCIEMI